MIPIQKFRKQKKIAAILEYTPCHTERKAFEQYLLAVRKDNTEKIAYLESFGDSLSESLEMYAPTNGACFLATPTKGSMSMAGFEGCFP